MAKAPLRQFLDGIEGSHPQEVLLQGPNEALGAAIPLGGPHEGGRALDVQEGKLLLEGLGHVLAAMIMPDREPAPDPLSKAAEVAPHPLKRVARRAAWMPTHSAEQ